VKVTGLARSVDPCPRPTAAPSGESGERLPSLTLPCLGRGAEQVDPARLGGKPTLINLWATWCGPCRKEMPALQAAYERHRGEVLFLGVDTRDDPHGAADFLEEVEVTYPQVADIDGELLAHLRIPGLPVTVILDADGHIVAQHVGPLDADTIEDLLAQAGA
jgi:thiol-disulfide isomerase/thioredoxin